MKPVQFLGAMLCAATLAACSGPWDIETLRGTTSTTAGTPFTQALTTEYRSLTIFEADKMNDWPDAYTFAGKGLAAARGDNVLPEDPRNWNLVPSKMAELDQWRGQLITALDNGGRTRLPAIAARAQAKYDCWVEQEEEGWQLQDIAACRAEFKALLAQLAPPPATPAPAPPPPAAAPVAQQEFIIYFDWDSAQLTAEGLRIVDQAARAAMANSTSRIVLVGFADRSGADGYNLRLSLRRADAVRAALSQRGVATQRTSVTALGETQPAVPTADGVREARNRRVTVNIR